MMDILTDLDPRSNYSMTKLQLIFTAWVMSAPFERRRRVSITNGRVEEDDYTKQSIYSMLYSIYRSIGEAPSDKGIPYELTFNTWGYAWPEGWGEAPNSGADPQRFGKNAYTGLYQFDEVERYVAEREGRVHVIEMGCGTGGGADHVCRNVLPRCTYNAIDMQQSAIDTCMGKFVSGLGGRLMGTRADCTDLPIVNEIADIVAVCETHVTAVSGVCEKEDQEFFNSAHRVLKPGGLMVWGNVIPDPTWKPCFDYLDSIGMELLEVRDVTSEAVTARDEDKARVKAYVDFALNKFAGFRIPIFGPIRKKEAEIAVKNFYRDPGTNLYDDMKTLVDTYKVVLLRKSA